METSISRIKLFGPGIPLAMKQLEEFTVELVAGKYSALTSAITHARHYIGEEADYEFIWAINPTTDEVFVLVQHIDEVLKINTQAKYTITTNLPNQKDLIESFESSEVSGVAFTFFRLYGPSISQAIELLNLNITNIPEIRTTTGILIGSYDYAIEWLHIPTIVEIISLLEEIDRILIGTGVTYTVATKSKLKTHSDL
ncbi:MAG: hypothetical protein ACFE9L_05300 [Candidatus Hodarchaeota archaeon]